MAITVSEARRLIRVRIPSALSSSQKRFHSKNGVEVEGVPKFFYFFYLEELAEAFACLLSFHPRAGMVMPNKRILRVCISLLAVVGMR